MTKLIRIDEQDRHLLKQYHWYIHITKSGNTYVRGYKIGDSSKNQTYLHHAIVGKIVGYEVDHINGNGLDNRRINLRHIVPSGNKRNRKGSVGYYFDKANNKWRAQIRVNGVKRCLGRYNTPQEARYAYKRAFSECISAETRSP